MRRIAHIATVLVVIVTSFAGGVQAEETSSGLGNNPLAPVVVVLVIGAIVVPPALNLYDITRDQPSVVKGSIGVVSGGLFLAAAANSYQNYGSDGGTTFVFVASTISLALGAAAIYLDVTSEESPVSVAPTVGFDGKSPDVGVAASVRF